MDERVFFEQGDVRVTNARFVVGSKTHAMNGVTSVSSHRMPASVVGPIIGIVVGLLILMGASGSGKILGVAVIAIAGYVLYSQKATHVVVLQSASGKVDALSSKDGGMIQGVVAALNDALIHRG
jgi:Family of unknown function (DUF6232)